MIEVSSRLAYWTAAHPSWRPTADWPREVGCVLYRHPDALVLIDPLIGANGWSFLDHEVARSSAPVVLPLTAPWHLRSAPAVSARYEASVWASAATRARLGEIPLREKLPTGIQAHAPRGVDEGQVAFFIEAERTLVVAEFFLGTEAGLEVRPSPATTDRDEFAKSLRELEDLPVERVLVAHGPPILRDGRAAVSSALRRFGV